METTTIKYKTKDITISYQKPSTFAIIGIEFLNRSNKCKERRDIYDLEPVQKVSVHKYSRRGQGVLRESIILNGELQFVVWYGKYSNGTN